MVDPVSNSMHVPFCAQITPEQEQTIIKAFSTGDPSEFQANGIKVGNAKYMFIRPEGDSFYGKKGVSGSALICVPSPLTTGVHRVAVVRRDEITRPAFDN